MRQFMETTFGPAEFEILDTVLDAWRSSYGLEKDSPDVELAAAVMLNLFREGHRTVEGLRTAVAHHRALSDLFSTAT